MKHRQINMLAGAALLCALAAPVVQAQAPYIWVDDKGMKHLSDQPPPPSVPANRILRQPRNTQVAPAPAAADDPAAMAGAPTADSGKLDPDGKLKRPPTLAERNADYTKRQSEAAATAQKTSQETSQKTADAANCENARSNQMALESGVRMSAFDKSGQRTYLTDAQRTERSRQNQAVLAGCAR